MRLDVVTGSRAEYGIMKNLIRTLVTDEYFDTRIIVTGMHLEEKYGLTYKDIERDGIPIYKKIESAMHDTSENGTMYSFEKTLSGFREHFLLERPDAILILGDRFEIFAVAIVAAMFRIPIIHLHGGEKTEGNYDEFIRHSISKMSTLHFTAAEEFRKRLIQLGEQPEMVHNVGALGVQNIEQSTRRTLEELQHDFDIPLKENKYIVVAFHPETLDDSGVLNHALLESLASIIDSYNVVFIGSNADTHADRIMENMNIFLQKYPSKATVKVSLSSQDYYTLISYSKCFVGNSSSGLIEVPSLSKASVNIGNRQRGRLYGNSVIPCENTVEAITKAVHQALMFDEAEIQNPYRGEDPKHNMIHIIKEKEDKLMNVSKVFYDLPFNV